MSESERPMDALLRALQERAKELHCLYQADEILNHPELTRDEVMHQLVDVIPPGWQYPDHCLARIVLEGKAYVRRAFDETPWALHAPVVFEGEEVGTLSVFYTEPFPAADEGPFLREERRLIRALAERIGQYLIQRHLRKMRDATLAGPEARDGKAQWAVILDFLRGTDRAMLMRLTRKMINYLGWSGFPEAETLLQEFAPQLSAVEAVGDENRPLERAVLKDVGALAERTFRAASNNFGQERVIDCIQAWIKEDRAGFLYSALENHETSLPEIATLLERFNAMELDVAELPAAMQTGLKVALLRRFFSDELSFVDKARSVVRVEDFYELSQRTIFPSGSHGKLGGKAAGLFVARRILEEVGEGAASSDPVRVPRTWYVASDALLHFIRYNSLEDVYDRKYRAIEQIRQEYPYLVQVFKGSPFPPDLSTALSAALDEFESRPIIVRSSSLLEDRIGSAFSGKYKSLFLANQGSKRERMAALQDAIAEVYASVFGPDPIEYRSDRGLLDVHEEMAIMIQEVVGRQVGPYFLPAFSGVANSTNEFRWSPRIRREDGLMRLVPGLGTRAVDRLADDYPVLVAPGQPGLRVNVSPDEVERYSPKKIDVINLDTHRFETVDLRSFLAAHGNELPLVHRMVSSLEEGYLRKPMGRQRLDFGRGEYVVTFEGLLADTGLVARVRRLLELLSQRLGVPVDLEFAHDGESFHLLQCRAQGHAADRGPDEIPRDVPAERVLFTANRFVSNGRVPDLAHLVYVDDEAYASLPDPMAMRRVGEAVGRLNRLLPRRGFALLGPGRWGSRGDIRLGVPVTYSQIRNTALLIEYARKRGNYVPDLSFGTHFFQDLVEAEIGYLPLYPDDPQVAFNEGFFRTAPNALARLLPQFVDLSETLRVIDLQDAAGGQLLRVRMNADLDMAVGFLEAP